MPAGKCRSLERSRRRVDVRPRDVTARRKTSATCAHIIVSQRFHGHPTADNLPRQSLGAVIVTAQRYLKQLSRLEDSHPVKQSLILARHYWDLHAARAQRYASIHWRPHQSHETRWNRMVSTITRHGITTDKVLALVIALYIQQEHKIGWLAFDDDYFRFQLARLVLQSVIIRRAPWLRSPGTPEVPGLRFMLWAGTRLQQDLGLFCGRCAAAIVGEAGLGFPAPTDQRPISKSAATRAAQRARYKPLPDDYDDD
jgi:hypothetical protein